MSIRAYRVIEIKLAENPSFRLWDNQKFMNFLDENTDFETNLTTDGSGMFEIPIKVLKEAVKMARELELEADTVKQIKSDIAFARYNKEDCVVYECF